VLLLDNVPTKECIEEPSGQVVYVNVLMVVLCVVPLCGVDVAVVSPSSSRESSRSQVPVSDASVLVLVLLCVRGVSIFVSRSPVPHFTSCSLMLPLLILLL
jgi:hypothetical protein